MASTTAKFQLAKKFNNSGRSEFLAFKGDLKSTLQLHPRKLHTVMFDGKLHSSVVRALSKELTDEKVTDQASIALRTEELLAECKEEAWAILDLNIADKALQTRLRRDYDDDGHAAWVYIESLYQVTGSDTRVTQAADRRKDLINAGMTGGTLQVVKQFCEELEAFNVELHGTSHHFAPALMTTTLLDALAVHHDSMVSTFKTMRAGTADWRDKYVDVRDALFELIEEADRVSAKTAHHHEHRLALRTGVSDAPQSEVATLRQEVSALTSAVQALVAAGSGSPGTSSRSVLRTATKSPCSECGKVHGMAHGCIGKRLALGELTIDEAAKLFAGNDPAKQRSQALLAQKTYAAHQASKGSTASNKAPAGVTPIKKLAMPTRVIKCQSVAHVFRGCGDLVLPEAPYTLLGMDSKADQHIFGDSRFFPLGYQPVNGTIQLETIDGTGPIALGQGVAVVFVEPNIIIEYPNALYVPGVKTNVISVAQAMRQNRAEVRFGEHCDIVFHGDDSNFTLPLTEQYDLIVRPATQEELQEASGRLAAGPRPSPAPAEPEAAVPLPDVITRGRSAGGPASKLAVQDAAQLWAARLPGVSADRLRQLPSLTADAPGQLQRVRPEQIADDATLTANAPKLHAPAVARYATSRRGDRTTTDIIGPFPPAKWTGNRYGIVFDDVHQNTVDVSVVPKKDYFPTSLESYLARNQHRHGCDFTGAVLYSDNEIVLNSAKVDCVLGKYSMRHENSCPYEPNQNPTERRMRALQEPMRIMHERGSAGDEYWEFSMLQAAIIHNRTPHAWGAEDDGKTPQERMTGVPASVASIRPMFCLAYVRIPPVQREGKISMRADKCIHLGTNPRGPGYRFEVISGPRKGKLIVSSQAIFREGTFPLADLAEGEPCGDDDFPSDEEMSAMDVHFAEDDAPPAAPPADHDSSAGNADCAGDDLAQDDGGPGDSDHAGRGDDGCDASAGDEGAEAPGDDGDLQDGSGGGGAGDDRGDDAEDGAQAVGLRRSSRLAGNSLPQTAMAYTRFRGVLATRVLSTNDEFDSDGVVTDVKHVVQTYATGIDMTDNLEPRPLSIDPAAVPQAAAKPTKLPRNFHDIMAIDDEAERRRRIEAYYKEWDGLFNAPSGIRAVPKPPGYYRTLRLKEIYSDKKGGEAKLRVVARGDLMQEGIDYDRTFSPTVKHTTFRIACAIAAERDMDISGGDVSQAYCHADWPHGPPIYSSKFPDGYEPCGADGEELALLIGNLYGKPDSGRNWYTRISYVLQNDDFKFQRSDYDHSLFFRWEGDKLMMIVLYVDDVVFFVDKGTDMRARFAERFSEYFPWKDFGDGIGDMNEFISIRLRKEPGKVMLDNERYIQELSEEMFPGGVHGVYSIPASNDLPKLVDEAVRCKADTARELDAHSKARYRRLVGALLFVSTTTRPDITYAVGMLSRCVAYPTTELLREAERVLIYLAQTRRLALTYTQGSKRSGVRATWAPTIGPTIEGASDANWEVQRSTSGYAFDMSNAAVSWGMKKQQSIALYTMEAEIMAGSLASCEAVWLRNILGELGFPQRAPTVLRMDNSAAIDLAHDPVSHASSKHIQRRELFIRELVHDRLVKPLYIKTSENVADIFTKPLSRKDFQRHRAALLGLV